MEEKKRKRNYSVIGIGREQAIAKGLVNAEWYRCPIPRDRLKQLSKRRNGPVARDTLIWFALLLGVGYVAYLSWGTWWAVPAFLAYGMLYMTPAVSKWHEFSHGTAFRTPWLNEAMYQVCSVMTLVQATHYRWTHVRHHTDTIIVGSDPEIVAPRPPVWRYLILGPLRVLRIPQFFLSILRRAFGPMVEFEKALIPASELGKLKWESRVFVLVYGGVIALCFYSGSVLPAMFLGLPIFYGAVLISLLTYTQHLGLKEDVLDHRLNTRTFHTNIVLRFLYSNMNYHLEHHMFPTVPYYSLPALHEEIKHDCPPANPSFWSALKETTVALWRQRKDTEYTVTRPLPVRTAPQGAAGKE